PSVRWNGSGPATLEGNYGALDGLAIACEGDSGPYEMYLDGLENGTHGLVQDWETASLGALDFQFSHPSTSGTTGGNLLPVPNESLVTNSYAYSGTNSCRIKFQF